MTSRTLLNIDKLFLPLHYLSEKIIALFQANKKSEHVLVIKFMGMGSLILFARLCEQNRIDKKKITLLTFSKQKEVCELLGFSSILIQTSNPIVFFIDCLKAIKKVKALNCSLIIDLERCSHAVSTFRNILSLIGKARSISFEASRNSISSRQKIYSVNNLTYHQIFMKGIEEMPRTEKENDYEEVPVQLKKILVNINASDYLLARRYPVSQFAELINSLHQWDDQLEFYFTGSSKEVDYVESLLALIPQVKATNVAGQWSLKKLASEISDCQLFITCDSGPLHLAAYLNADAVVIWGPTQPKHFGYEKHPSLHSVSLNLSCSPCFTQPFSDYGVACNKRINCLKNLNSGLIFNQATKLISSTSDLRTIPKNFYLKTKSKTQDHEVVH